ncbi:MAG: hypothetical protein ACR2PJ_00845 [Pseudomonadales bacterium]
MNNLLLLVRREFWEHRATFLVLPAVITIFLSLLLIAMFASASYYGPSGINDEPSIRNDVARLLEALRSDNEVDWSAVMQPVMQTAEAPFLFTLWLAVFMYLLGSLYGERKDRSLLFWKSLPVSDLATVLSKLMAALIFVPLVYFAGMVVVQLTALLALTLATSGTEVDAWRNIWAPSALPLVWLDFICRILFQALWCLPLYGWLLLVSVLARSAPLAWALGIPLGLALVDIALIDLRLYAWFETHLAVTKPEAYPYELRHYLADKLFTLDMLSALTVGSGLVALAIWQRRQAHEIW